MKYPAKAECLHADTLSHGVDLSQTLHFKMFNWEHEHAAIQTQMQCDIYFESWLSSIYIYEFYVPKL